MKATRLTIRRDIRRPDDAAAAPFVDAPTGFVVDAMGRFGAIDGAIRRIAGTARVVGPIVTVSTVPRDNLAPWAALTVVRPGDVLMIATGDYTGASVIGDLYVMMARNAGVAAIVTDGMVRDVAGIEAGGIPVHARGLSPNSPFKNGPGEINGAISLGGVSIGAGDLAICDIDGVVIVPQARLAAVARDLSEVREKEALMDRQVHAGTTQPSWLAGVLEQDDIVYVD